MHNRTRTGTLFSFLVFVGMLTTAGCGMHQTNRFQTSFLPAAPLAASAEAAALPAPPEIKPNVFLRDMPAFLLQNPQLPAKKTRGDALVLQADERFQRGKRSYQAGDTAGARREFNAAMDLMLEASEHKPADRQDYERRLDDLADADPPLRSRGSRRFGRRGRRQIGESRRSKTSCR